MTNQKLMRKEATSAAGFTLIELMIVIAIIGILAAVAIPNFLKARERAQFSQALETLQGLKVAEEMYITDNNIYTANIKELAMYMIPGCSDVTGVAAPCDKLQTRIDSNLRTTPVVGITLTGNSYSYQIKGNAFDRSNGNTGCPVCVTPNGYLPAKFAQCEPAVMTCP